MKFTICSNVYVPISDEGFSQVYLDENVFFEYSYFINYNKFETDHGRDEKHAVHFFEN